MARSQDRGPGTLRASTLNWTNYRGRDIQGIGDKHVTWVHNVVNMHARMCVDAIESKKGLQLSSEEAVWRKIIWRPR